MIDEAKDQGSGTGRECIVVGCIDLQVGGVVPFSNRNHRRGN